MKELKDMGECEVVVLVGSFRGWSVESRRRFADGWSASWWSETEKRRVSHAGVIATAVYFEGAGPSNEEVIKSLEGTWQRN
jgi:hypothetical protein